MILGGGDTGSDCLGTSNRQGAIVVHQFELLPMPPDTRTADMPWPDWPMILRTSTSHEEGVNRDWSINTKKFSGENGAVKKLHGVRLNWKRDDGRMVMEEIQAATSRSNATWCCSRWASSDLSPTESSRSLASSSTRAATCSAITISRACREFSPPAIRVAGSRWWCWAIWEGRECARAVDAYLMGESFLPASPELLG